MTDVSRLIALFSVLFFGALTTVYGEESDELIDYTPTLERIGIGNEPSILGRCSDEYSAVRVTGLVAGQAFVVLRVESTTDGKILTKRLIVNGNPQSPTSYRVSESEWTTISDLLSKSGFWSYEIDDSEWRPSGELLWIEACINDKFRSISIYPAIDNRMTDVIGFLAKLTA